MVREQLENIKLHKEPKGNKYETRYRKYPRKLKDRQTTALHLRAEDRFMRYENKATNKALGVVEESNVFDKNYEEYGQGNYRRKENIGISNQSGLSTRVIRLILDGKINMEEAFKVQHELDKEILFGGARYFHKDNDMRLDEPVLEKKEKEKIKLFAKELAKQFI